MTVFRTLTKNPAAATLVFLALFLYIFNIVPPVGPEKLGTREYFSLMASFWIVFILKELPKTYYLIIFANYSQVIFSLLTVFINGTNDFWYVQFAIRNVLYINGAIAIAYMMPRSYTFNDFLFLIVLTIIVNDLISFIGFLNPSVRSFILSIQQFGDSKQIANTIKFGVRIVGIGNNIFYFGGTINGMGIIFSFFLLIQKHIRIFVGIVLITFLTIVGLFVARTTIVGFLLGMLLFVWKTSIRVKTNTFFLTSSLIVLAFFSNMFNDINTSHAFEIFYKYDDLDTVQSIHHLKTMYDRDMGFSTLLLGDGLSKQGGLYYGNTDVGYLRNILYFGILGTIWGYLYYEYYILKKLYLYENKAMRLVAILGIYLFALNFKGLPDYNFFLFLLIGYYIRRHTIIKNALKKALAAEKGDKVKILSEGNCN